jgi:hypothetical protein
MVKAQCKSVQVALSLGSWSKRTSTNKGGGESPQRRKGHGRSVNQLRYLRFAAVNTLQGNVLSTYSRFLGGLSEEYALLFCHLVFYPFFPSSPFSFLSQDTKRNLLVSFIATVSARSRGPSLA